MKLFFRKLGEGQPLVILHGLFGMSDNWLTIGKELSKNYSVFLVDQRNHGQSPHSDVFNYKVMSDDLFEFANEHHLNKAIIIGHSMGGKTAMQFSIEHPEKINKLIVVDIAPKYYSHHHQEIINALLSMDLSKIKSRKEAEEQLSLKIKDESTKQFLLKNLYWLPCAKASRSAESLGWRFNLETLSKNKDVVGEAINENNHFDKPTLFVKGEKSDYILDEDMSLIKKIFPKAELITIPNSGHWVHADNPKEFLKDLVNFIESQ